MAADYLEYMKKEKEIKDRQRKEEEEIDAVFTRLGKIELGKETCSKSKEKVMIIFKKFLFKALKLFES